MSFESIPIPWEQPRREPQSMRRAGMLVDLRRCIGCHGCSISCKTEHDTPLGIFRTRTHWVQPPAEKQDARMAFVPTMCVQCADAPCVNACPTKAIGRLDDGRVVVDDALCDGNAACVEACPYDAIAVNPQTKKAEKCDFCEHRSAVGMDPACVEACPTTALRFGDFGDPSDEVTRYADEHGAVGYRESEGTQPYVRYIGLEPWMEQKAPGVQLQPGEDEVIYEQSQEQRARRGGPR